MGKKEAVDTITHPSETNVIKIGHRHIPDGVKRWPLECQNNQVEMCYSEL